jgi:hypothetical protein
MYYIIHAGIVIVTSRSYQLRSSLYTHTYTRTYIHNNAVLEELLRKLACCRYDLSSEELEEHISSDQVSRVSECTAGLPGCREY